MPYVRPEDENTDSRQASDPHGRRSARRIGILVFDGFSLLGAGMVAEIFHAANKISRSDPGDDCFYDVRFLSSHGGNIACSASVLVWTDELEARHDIGFDVIFVAGGVKAHNAAGDERLHCWLGAVYPKTSALTESADGHAVLAAAGILPNDEAPQRPGTRAMSSPGEPTSYGKSLKSALAIIKNDLGHDVARGVAEHLTPTWSPDLVPRRNGFLSVGDKMREAARWLHENCERSISVADAAQIAAMSERHFLRCFKLAIGILPSDYLLRIRLEMASRLLAETDLPVDKIARRSGLSNGDRLAKIFRKRMSISPIEFRQHSRSAV
ncbi:GlxA family transcriptional regulator [Cupriavidus basilensis]|uniref:GlxA family transcriptional regulator n=1 Tax=Cupriavidus basilensis TaxID=68895 RepID=UPI0039F6CFF0